MRKMTILTIVAAATTLLLGCHESDEPDTVTGPELESIPMEAGAEGVTDATLYGDGDLDRTVGTPTTPSQSAPDRSFGRAAPMGSHLTKDRTNTSP